MQNNFQIAEKEGLQIKNKKCKTNKTSTELEFVNT